LTADSGFGTGADGTRKEPGSPGRPAVFLDRDGTLIHDRHHLADPAGVELLPGAGQALARLNQAGFAVVLVTNQSGIGRGRFTEADYHAVQTRLRELLAAEGARLDAEYHCPLAPEEPDPEARRKPGAGMFLQAVREQGLDPARSWLVGDRARDVAAAASLGARAVVVRSAQTEGDLPRNVPVADSLAAAAELILGAQRARSSPGAAGGH
jgi:D-glycero-D-manno-heptose 1,7-bisphosphate phosphatase